MSSLSTLLVCERRFYPGHTKNNTRRPIDPISLLSTCWVMMYHPIMDHVRHDMRYLLIVFMVVLKAFQFSYDSLYSLWAAKDITTCSSSSGAWISLSLSLFFSFHHLLVCRLSFLKLLMVSKEASL